MAAPQPYPFGFFTEASIDLASRPHYWMRWSSKFLSCVHGMNRPPRVLKEQGNFRISAGTIDSIRLIQQHGLWVMGGFIVGFDSDPPDIFDPQIEFVERAAIPWAMTVSCRRRLPLRV